MIIYPITFFLLAAIFVVSFIFHDADSAEDDIWFKILIFASIAGAIHGVILNIHLLVSFLF